MTLALCERCSEGSTSLFLWPKGKFAEDDDEAALECHFPCTEEEEEDGFNSFYSQ